MRNRSSSSSRLPGPPLHRVEQGELAVQQRLAAPGQVAEDVADALPQPGLAHGRFHGGLLHRGERLPDLADLVGAGGQLGRLGGDVHVLAGGQPLTTYGSRSLASSSAESRRSRSSRTMPRPTRSDTTMDSTTASRPRPPARISSR